MIPRPGHVLVPLLAALLGAPIPPAAAAQAPAPDYGRVARALVEGPIDRMQARYLERAVGDARAADVDTLLVRIDTDGGQVHYAREMFKAVLDLERDGIRTVAFVDFRAISAGALIAYGHEEVWMAETASIGDIGVIFRNPEGGIEYAPEKFETVVRALLTQAAEQRGWNRGVLLKMTAHKQKLYRITLPDGREEYVIEDDLPDFLSRHPEVDREDEDQVIVYRGEDRLITLTGLEAVDLDMATGIANDAAAMHARLGVTPEAMLDLRPQATERVAGALSRFAPVLAGLAMLFLIFELKTPGVGLWAALAAVLGAGFLLSQYSLDMIENFELVLIGIGIVLVVTEVVTMAGGGLLAALGALVAFTGLVLSLLPNEFDFDLDDPVFLEALGDAAFGGAIAVGIVVAGVLLAIHYLPRTSLHRRLAVVGEVTGTADPDRDTRSEALLGRRGEAREALRPGGTVQVGDESLSARAEHGAYIERGAEVEIVAVEFGEVVVRPCPPGAGGGTGDGS